MSRAAGGAIMKSRNTSPESLYVFGGAALVQGLPPGRWEVFERDNFEEALRTGRVRNRARLISRTLADPDGRLLLPDTDPLIDELPAAPRERLFRIAVHLSGMTRTRRRLPLALREVAGLYTLDSRPYKALWPGSAIKRAFEQGRLGDVDRLLGALRRSCRPEYREAAWWVLVYSSAWQNVREADLPAYLRQAVYQCASGFFKANRSARGRQPRSDRPSDTREAGMSLLGLRVEWFEVDEFTGAEPLGTAGGRTPLPRYDWADDDDGIAATGWRAGLEQGAAAVLTEPGQRDDEPSRSDRVFDSLGGPGVDEEPSPVAGDEEEDFS